MDDVEVWLPREADGDGDVDVEAVVVVVVVEGLCWASRSISVVGAEKEADV